MATLSGMSEQVRGQVHDLGEDRTTIGRKDDNDISIDNATVSGHHCVLAWEDGHCVLRDLGSTNGTRVNNKIIRQSELHSKDIVRVGSVEFVFNDENESPSKTGSFSAAEVTEETGGSAGAPATFSSISPFGARKKDTRNFWFVLVVILGLLALGVVGYFVYTLVTTS